MENVLIASLGESPIVITAMYDLLKKEKGIAIDRVIVLYPQKAYLIDFAFDMIREALRDRCEVVPEAMPFADVANEADSLSFLQTIYRLLNTEQQSANAVYLSLAGGRKNMAALMAIVVPLFPCVKGLYHVIDQDENTNYNYHFKAIEEINALPAEHRRPYFLLNDEQLARLKLVKIPYGRQQQVSEEYRALLFSITAEQLDELWAKNPAQAATIETYQQITQGSTFTPVLNLKWTARVKQEYERMLRDNAPQAQRFAVCFKQMQDPHHLFEAIKDSGLTRFSHSFHFYKRRRTVERPFYHTEPQNIELLPKGKGVKIDTVIISGLAVEQDDGSYRPTSDQLLQAFDPEEATATIPLEGPISDVSAESVLIVPLGDSPMIATQLYTLLTHKGSHIREIVLVYPAKMKAGAELVAKAFEDEGQQVRCVQKAMRDFDDIDSTAACQAFEQALAEAIDEARTRRPDFQVELALSGGRKGMSALAMFVAQRKDIHYLYHTLITDSDQKLLARIEKETTVDALRPTGPSKQVRNNRLFLREYEGDGPYTKFVLFKVPVLPAQG